MRLKTLLLWILCLTVRVAAAEKALWFQLDQNSGLSNTFAHLLLEQFQSQNLFEIAQQKVSAQELNTHLASLTGNEQPIFIQCNFQTYTDLLKSDKTRQLLSDTRLEFTSSRLVSVPFYVLSRGNQQSKLTDPISIAFITLPIEGIIPVEDADLLTMFSQILGKPKTSIRIFREREAYTAAKKFFEGAYHLVGIYEDEPSSLLDEFQINLVDELGARSAAMLPFDTSRSSQLIEVSQQRLKYLYFTYPEVSFLETQSPLIAVVQEVDPNTPVLLSSVRGSVLRQAISNAYFLLFAKVRDTSLQELSRRNLQRMLLLNAYMNEPANRYKSLAFLGHLLLMKDKKWKDRRLNEVNEQKVAIFQKQLNLERITARSLFEWLDLKIPDIDRRELFTGDVSRLYENALQQIEEGLKEGKGKGRNNFEQARRSLIAALLEGEEPKNIKGSRGLWSISDYNPYYELARVTYYLEHEN